MSEYRGFLIETVVAPAAGGYTARVSAKRAQPRQPRKAFYFPPLGPKSTPEAAADHAVTWARQFIDENA